MLHAVGIQFQHMRDTGGSRQFAGGPGGVKDLVM